MRVHRGAAWATLLLSAMAVPCVRAATRKSHGVHLGSVRTVPYSREGDPAGAAAGETALKIRALVVDGRVKEWTTGEVHDVTDRSFVVRRALRLNDSLPGETKLRWVWQRGPWLLVNRVSGRIAALKLPDYNPAVSRVAWFRDYGAYCGVTPSGKSLYAVVSQLAVRRPVLAKKLEPYDAQTSPNPACGAVEWQREPLRVTFHPAGKQAESFHLMAGSAVLVEEPDDATETPDQPGQPK